MDTDFSKHSTDELLKLRDQMQTQVGLEGASTDQLLQMRAKEEQRLKVNEVPEQEETSFSPYNALSGVLNSIPAVRAFNHVSEGKQDPRYNQLGGFAGEGLRDMSALSQIERGKVTTMTDKGYGNVVKSALGDRLQGAPIQDKHGQEIITYKGDDGETYQTYINQPGLDYQDVDRFANSALPFMLTGGATGFATRGAGLLGRSTAQGLMALGTDMVMQGQGMRDGSEMPTNYVRAGLATLGGAGGEVLGTLVSKALNNPKYYNKATGKLSEEGRKWAKSNEVDPDAVEEGVAVYLNQNIDKAADPKELAVQARSLEFDIPTSRAQRTKSFDDAFAEKQLRTAQFGRDSEVAINAFDKKQTKALNDAALDNVGGQLAPKAAGQEKATLGEDIRHGLGEIYSRGRAEEKKIWSEIGPMYPKEGAFESLPDIVNAKALKAGVRPVEGLTDQSIEMRNIMKSFIAGDLTTDSFNVLPKQIKGKAVGATNLDGVERLSIDEARRMLLKAKSDAKPGSQDARLANHLYEGFNEWIDDAAKRALIQADHPEAYAALKSARAFTREQRKLFEPRDKYGKLTPSAKKIAKIMESEDSAEGVVSALFGAGSEVSQLSNGAVDTLRHMKKLLVPSDRSKTFDSIKMAYWVKLVQDKKGNINSPLKLSGNIDKAFNNHGTALRILFNKRELALIKRFQKVSKDLHVPDPNISNSAIGVGKLARDVTKTALKSQSQRELFSKRNVLLSRIYSALAKVPDVARKPTGKKLQDRHLSEAIKLKSGKSAPFVRGAFTAGVMPRSQEQ